MNVCEQLAQYAHEGRVPEKFAHIIKNFFNSYASAVPSEKLSHSEIDALLKQYLEMVVRQIESPFSFQAFHTRMTSPVDYYTFGLDFMRPLIQFEKSKVSGLDQIAIMMQQLQNGENVILLGNHQIEPDPQIISLLLEKSFPEFAENLIFVAGDRVISDPLAVPLSMGCNLLCIYSKKRIDIPPELKPEKQLHNQRTMKRMSELLAEGGKAIYVAPSGGRDRANGKGQVDVAPFDPQSIEMFWLMAQKSKKQTHFYPLALSTYNLLPPPQSIDPELGETRHTSCSPAHLAFGKEIDMERFPGNHEPDKKIKRQRRAEYIWHLVKKDYDILTQSP